GVIATILFAILFQAPLPALWLILIVACAAAVDEVGHDRSTDTSYWYGVVFRFRPILKFVIISLGILTWIPYHIMFNVLGFDLGYGVMNQVLTQKKREGNGKGSL
ncbi:MAG: hypothetical protein NWE83_05030, partial [Candidatus Bathyarchaeota archaeon]|nr:hypothetical protein [Candidatus Bathyarchaeota archaeon]